MNYFAVVEGAPSETIVQVVKRRKVADWCLESGCVYSCAACVELGAVFCIQPVFLVYKSTLEQM